MSKRMVIISDLHCGHRAGLTPPGYQYPESGSGRRGGFAITQRKLWDWYIKEAGQLGKVDCLVINGDAIDGKGTMSGGRELITGDRDEQIDMAVQCAEVFKARKVYVVEGTPYHTGKEESWEHLLAVQLDCNMEDDAKQGPAQFGAHIWVDMDGVVFDFRHKVGSSTIPHGRYTAPQRAALWNSLWAERGYQPNAKIIVRSHVHYFTAGFDSQKMVITTPALQTHSNFGSREIDGTNDIGFLSFTVDKGAPVLHTHFCDLRDIARAKVLKV